MKRSGILKNALKGFTAGFLFTGFEIFYVLIFYAKLKNEFHLYNILLPITVLALSGAVLGIAAGLIFRKNGGVNTKYTAYLFVVIGAGFIIKGLISQAVSHFLLKPMTIFCTVSCLWLFLIWIAVRKTGKKLFIFSFCVWIIVALLSIYPLVSFQKTAVASVSRQTEKKPNVLLIVIDTLRRDHIGIYNEIPVFTPVIDSLGQSGVVFEDARSSVPMTLPSHTSLFTGTYPPFHGIRVNHMFTVGSEIPLFQEELGKAGYLTSAFVSAMVLENGCGLERGFSVYDDKISEWWKKLLISKRVPLISRPLFSRIGLIHGSLELERAGEETVRQAIKWLEKNRQAPFFMWVHIFDPHGPLNPPKKFRDLYAKGAELKVDDIETTRLLYKAEVSYADYAVGLLLGALRKQHLENNTMVVLTSDHGQALGEIEGYIGHADCVYESALKIPLIFSWQGSWKERSRVTSEAELVDVFPTIFEALHIETKIKAQGQSLLNHLIPGQAEVTESSRKYHYFELMSSKPKQGCIEDTYKYIKNMESGDGRLFDLAMDPLEEKEISAEQPKVFIRLRNSLDSLIIKYETGSYAKESKKRKLSMEDRDALKALGYIK